MMPSENADLQPEGGGIQSVPQGIQPSEPGGAGPEVSATAPPDKAKRQPRKKRAAAGKARELAASLTGIAVLTGAALPDAERMAPRLSVQVPITAFSRALAQHLRGEPIFLRVSTGAVVTVDPETGEVEEMTPVRFASWAEGFVTFTKETRGEEGVVSISADAAARVLASDVFRKSLRPLKAVHLVRLPTWANAQRTAVKLLPEGYDESAACYTVNTVPYGESLPLPEAVGFLLDSFAEFPFARPDDEPKQQLYRNRSFSVQIAAMLGLYCRPMLAGGLRPAVAVQANQPGSGKTLLIRMALAPVFGAVAVQALPRDENELGKLLTTAAAEGHLYKVFDNVSGFLASAELESFLTSPRRSGRILGRTESVDAENVLNVFITGNGLSISGDLARRCLLLDLWSAEEVTGRQIKKPIEEEWLSSPEARAGFLAAMWALVKHWGLSECPRSQGARLASFESFSAVVGGIVTAAGFADPIAPPEVRLDEKAAAWAALFKALADPLPDGGFADYSLDALKESAEEGNLLEILIGDVKSPKVALGRRIKSGGWMGRRFTDSHGRPFEFGKRHAAVGSLYRVRNLLAPSPENETDPDI